MVTLNSNPIRKHAGTVIRGLLLSFGFFAGVASAQDVDEVPLVSQMPLSVGGSVPSNVLLTPSVEFPTINSKANLGNFNKNTEYNGYFDSRKCYLYNYSATEADRYFTPTGSRLAVPATCSAASLQWSGNFLNWAATQTIDPFRKALTGGLRHVDSQTETILEKARHDGQGNLATYFPLQNITADVSLVTPISWANFRTRIDGAGNRMLFTRDGALAVGEDMPAAGNIYEYNPGAPAASLPNANPNRIYSVVIRVKVCDPAHGVEPNCVAYGSNYKPEGLIQKYQRKMRFSVFGYLLDNGMFRDGGVLRANQKFVGPQLLDSADGQWKDNTYKEWDANTGVFAVNPNPADATATSTSVGGGHNVVNSGVVNYINKFGQLTGTNAKNYDPVSELYYTATRYLRKLEPVPSYNDLTRRYDVAGGTAVGAGVGRWNMTDGFPVITTWDDPYQYWCQNTAIIGIGDVYTHRDKNLTGRESGTDEPATPALVTNDPSFSGAGKHDVPWWSKKAYALEGVDYNSTFANQNSPYIVGLSYYIHTQDLRTDLGSTEAIRRKRQTASTHWVDVREGQRVEPRERNQYWMATKYGGFLVPVLDANNDGVPDFNSETHATSFPAAWWDSGETLTSNSSNTGAWPNDVPYRRTNNFYVADRPDTMISGLSRAFAKFGSESLGSGASLAANSTRLDTTTLTFQAQFQNSIWLGQLNAYKVDPATGALSANPLWSAGSRLKAKTWNSRNIKVNASGALTSFEWANLTATQKAAMNTLWAPDLGLTGTDDGAHVLEYIRGNQTLEEQKPGGVFRTRTAPQETWSPMLGDIVNSTPVFVGVPNAALFATSPGTWNGKTDHDDFAAAKASRTPVVWVGGNDGMLHAFDASVTAAGNATATSGDEVFAFVPNVSIASGLADYANPNYVHKYFVDGDIAVSDVYVDNAWKTVLVATMGRGTPGIFALDVTNPANPLFLWEKSAADIPDLGHNIGRPVIAQVANGDWRVILGNGPDSADGTATLITIKLGDGTTTTQELDAGDANGLSAVLARDSDADGLADVVYAGDLEGNLWKVTSFTGSNDTADATAIFAAEDSTGTPQPITAAPLVGKDPATLMTWVFFGTGKFLNEDDLITTQTQTWYGIKDTGTAVTRGDLVVRTVTGLGDISVDHDNNPVTPPEVIFQVRTVSEATSGDMADAGGWRMDLPVSKERIVVPNRFQGSALIGTTRIPDASDACAPTGGGFIMALNPFTGARLSQTFFDANRDGKFDEKDMLNGQIVSGLGIDSSPNNPIFIDNVMQFSKDDGTTDAVRVQGSSAESRRASWREITR